MNIEDLIEKLHARYDMCAYSYSVGSDTEIRGYNLLSPDGVGCAVRHENDALLMGFYATLEHGHFMYPTLGSHLFGIATDKAYSTCLQVVDACKNIK